MRFAFLKKTSRAPAPPPSTPVSAAPPGPPDRRRRPPAAMAQPEEFAFQVSLPLGRQRAVEGPEAGTRPARALGAFWIGRRRERLARLLPRPGPGSRHRKRVHPFRRRARGFRAAERGRAARRAAAAPRAPAEAGPPTAACRPFPRPGTQAEINQLLSLIINTFYSNTVRPRGAGAGAAPKAPRAAARSFLDFGAKTPRAPRPPPPPQPHPNPAPPPTQPRRRSSSAS